MDSLIDAVEVFKQNEMEESSILDFGVNDDPMSALQSPNKSPEKNEKGKKANDKNIFVYKNENEDDLINDEKDDSSDTKGINTPNLSKIHSVSNRKSQNLEI